MKLFGVRQESRESDYPRPHEAASPPFLGKWGVLGCYLPAGLMPPDDAKRYLQGPHEEKSFTAVSPKLPPSSLSATTPGENFVSTQSGSSGSPPRVSSSPTAWPPGMAR